MSLASRRLKSNSIYAAGAHGTRRLLAVADIDNCSELCPIAGPGGRSLGGACRQGLRCRHQGKCPEQRNAARASACTQAMRDRHANDAQFSPSPRSPQRYRGRLPGKTGDCREKSREMPRFCARYCASAPEARQFGAISDVSGALNAAGRGGPPGVCDDAIRLENLRQSLRPRLLGIGVAAVLALPVAGARNRRRRPGHRRPRNSGGSGRPSAADASRSSAQCPPGRARKRACAGQPARGAKQCAWAQRVQTGQREYTQYWRLWPDPSICTGC